MTDDTNDNDRQSGAPGPAIGKVENFVAGLSQRLRSEGIDFEIDVRPVSLGPGLTDVFINLVPGPGLFIMCAEHSDTARIVTDRREYDVPWDELPLRVHELLLYGPR